MFAALLLVKFEDICCKKHQTIKPFGNVKLEFAKKKKETSTTQGPFIRINVEVTLPAAG